ncbi:hypothetical protein QEN19_002075 [Hanseniaspora menglaensis]
MGYNAPNHDPKYVEYQPLYEKKLNQFLNFSGPYKNENLGKFMLYEKFKAVDKINQSLINGAYYQVPYNKENPVDPENRPDWKPLIEKCNENNLWKEIYENQPFGPSWTTTWFKIKICIPKDLLQKYKPQRWVFQFDCQNEGLVIVPKKNKNKTIYMPITAFSGNNERIDYILNIKNYNEDFNHFFYIECGNNGMFGNGPTEIDPPTDNRWFHLSKCDLVLPDWEARGLFYDFQQCKDLALKMPQESFFKHYIRKTCLEIMDIFDSDDRSSILKCRKYFTEKLLPKLEEYNSENTNEFDSMYAFGNCHIDLSWLWPFAETKRKVVRSWSSQIKFIEEYPEFQFVISQAQSVKWLKDAHPEFFNKILQHSDQFLIAGGSWVENDTNLPSGEGLSRQLFYGQRWFYKNFNKTICKTMWLPDSFGYSAALPQIGKLSQMDYFVTQKLSWNNINKFPHSTFYWQGIDGSEILTHCPPADTYTSDCSVDDILKVVRNGKSKDIEGGSLYLFGKGDGGGGPTEEQINKLRRMREINKKIGSEVPSISMNTKNSPEKFFKNILELNKGKNNIPSYIGELYLEFHRGTYTTQSIIKRFMRKSETLLVELELIATYASLVLSEYKYPYQAINSMWEDVLLCQFHDVLPGSAIEMNYKYESKKLLHNVLKQSAILFEKIAKKLNAETSFPKCYESDEISNIVEDSEQFIMWSDYLTVAISKKTGNITSIKNSLNGKEFIDIKTGKNKKGANQFVLFDDKPDNWQAWDTELFNIEDYKYVTNLKSISIDKLKGTIISVFDIGDDCFITSSVSLDKDLIKINTKVKNWNKENKFLKVEFPVNIHNPVCTYDIQFGNKKIDTVFYKFEVCHHKYADLSEASKGVSIINDCKYGFSTLGNLMKLSLLRSPKRPDAHADMGDHEINYAIYPHVGALNMDTINKSVDFNRVAMSSLRLDKNFVKVQPIYDCDKNNFNIKISSIKRGEDDNWESEYTTLKKNEPETKSIVVRVYDPLGGEISGKIQVSEDFKITKVVPIDNLEMPIETIKQIDIIEDTSFIFSLRAFEIKLFRIYF